MAKIGSMDQIVSLGSYGFGKTLYKNGVPYQYGHGCTHMVNLRVWVLTYILRTNTR